MKDVYSAIKYTYEEPQIVRACFVSIPLILTIELFGAVMFARVPFMVGSVPARI